MPLHIPMANKRTSSSATLKSSSSINNIASLSVNKSSAFLGPSQWRVTDEEHSGRLLSNIRWLQTIGSMSDITFTYEDKTIKANRVVLAAVSPVMRDVFLKRENLMNAEVIPPEALRELVDFVYSATAEVSYDAIKKIQSASRVLQVPSLLQMSTKLLSQLPQSARYVRPKLTKIKSLDDDITEGHKKVELEKSEPKIDNENLNYAENELEKLNLGNELSRRNNRNSIRLTFHSRSGTPLNRSIEDLRRFSDVSSVGGSSDKLNDLPRRETRTPSLPEVRIHKVNDLEKVQKISSKAQRILGSDRILLQKNSQHYLSRSFEEDLILRPRSVSDQTPQNPILLSAFVDAPSDPSQRHLNSFSTSKDNCNGTWPRILKSSPVRPRTPDRWKLLNSSDSIESKSSIGNIEGSSVTEQPNLVARPKICKDVLTVRFKSNTVPELLKGLNTLREQGHFSDLTLTVGSSKIRCHRVILSASSSIFRAILDRFSSREIALTKVDDNAMLELVRFIYTGQCSIDRDNVVSVLRAARRFKIPFLTKQCTNYLDHHCGGFNNFFTPVNVLFVCKMAATHGCMKLREESRKFAISHFWEVAETNAFKELTPLELNRLISSESLKTARLRDPELEHLFYNAILNWLTHAPTLRIPMMTSRFMKFVQFSNLKVAVLNNLVSKEMAIVLDKEIRERVEEAMRAKSSSLPRRSVSMRQLSTFKVFIDQPTTAPSDIRCLVTREEEKQMKTWVSRLRPEEADWEAVTSSPITGRGYAVTSYAEALYVAGGSDATKNVRTSNAVYKYENSSWSMLPTMRLHRSHFSLIPVDGAIYALGGLSESFDKGHVDCCPTASIEKIDLLSNNGNQKWKLVSSLNTTSYFHAAASCFLTSSRRVTSSLSDLDQDESNKSRPPASPSKKKTFGHRLTLAINAGIEEARNKTQKKSSPRGSNKHKKHNEEKESSQNSLTPVKSSASRKVIAVCGGKTNPMQCVLFDVEQNKCSVASLLPVQCTNPVMTSFRSRVYVVCNDVTQTAAGFRCFENDLNFDRWTEISKPLSLNPSAYITNDISHENLSRLITKSPLSCTAVNNSILVTMLLGNVTISQYYDVASSRWKASMKSAKLNKNADFPIKDFHVLVFNK